MKQIILKDLLIKNNIKDAVNSSIVLKIIKTENYVINNIKHTKCICEDDSGWKSKIAGIKRQRRNPVHKIIECPRSAHSIIFLWKNDKKYVILNNMYCRKTDLICNR